jgi:hypothetical protein
MKRDAFRSYSKGKILDEKEGCKPIGKEAGG